MHLLVWDPRKLLEGIVRGLMWKDKKEVINKGLEGVNEGKLSPQGDRSVKGRVP